MKDDWKIVGLERLLDGILNKVIELAIENFVESRPEALKSQIQVIRAVTRIEQNSFLK